MGSVVSTSKSSYESPNSIKAGIWAILPMLLGTAPFGVVFGVFALDIGFGFIGAQSLSSFVFAGSSQFVGVNLYGQGASLEIIFWTIFLVNFRHFLYGASLGPKLLGTSSRHRVLISFFLTDEAFAVVSKFKKVHFRYYWGAALAMYFNWQIWTGIGIFFAPYLKSIMAINFGFIIVPAFLAIIFQQAINKAARFCGLLSGFLALFLNSLPHQMGVIIAALISIFLTLLCESIFSSKDFNKRRYN